MNTVFVGFLASLIASLGTGMGAMPILITDRLNQRYQGILLGLGAGVMLAASAFSLILPSTEIAIANGNSSQSAAVIVSLGIMLGAALLWFAHEYFPHEHFFQGKEGRSLPNFKQLWLFILAITIHNFPEGLAVGVGFDAANLNQGIPLALGIGLQNIPEGLVVALALRELKYSIPYALGVAWLTGLVEPVGGFLGASLASLGQIFLPWGMAIAAGAMLFVIVDEIIPEIDRKAAAQQGTLGIILGFVSMMFLDISLG